MKGENNILFNDLSGIIESGKKQAVSRVNRTIVQVYWQVGFRINKFILENKRGEYGKEIVANLSKQLEVKYGKQFNEKNVRRMLQFSERFEYKSIFPTPSGKLSWSHFIELLPLKESKSRKYYLDQICRELWSVRELRHQISRKAFERNEIAQVQLCGSSEEIKNSFKGPYFFDFLGINEGYLENDLEAAILNKLERFVLELGKGFAFVERQKRLIIDGQDFYMDLLFYHRKLKRLIVIELKLGKFKAAHKGQMDLYLKWLDKHEKQEGENTPIGLILCAEKSKEQIELLEMGKNGIMVAEYWTELPPKKLLEEKLNQALIEAKRNILSKPL